MIDGSDPHGALAEHLFRHHAARLTAHLTRRLGPARLELVEDAVQEALLRALRVWPFEGTPERPEAWLHRVAWNAARDALRTERTAAEHAPGLARADGESADEFEADEVRDETLAMAFVCCHPELTPTSRVALSLKSLCGFSTREIAAALLMREATVGQRLTRAKETLRTRAVDFGIPTQDRLPERLDNLLDVVYLLFNEGYSAHGGDALVRHELCAEALRLCALLVADGAPTAKPEAFALASLCHLQAARLPARLDAEGRPVPLAEQDRARWDRAAIAQGFWLFARSLHGGREHALHLEAAIASEHAKAANYAATDWAAILRLYDRLTALRDTPPVRLNRAVAVAKVHGAAAGLEELAALADEARLAGDHLFDATRGRLLWSLGRDDEAAEAFGAAAQKARTTPERALLREWSMRAREGDEPPAW